MNNERILRLCLRYKRCRGCKRLIPRGLHSKMGCKYFCSFCTHQPRKKRELFLEWYEKEAKLLEDVLPNPMPTLAEVRKMLWELKKNE